MAPLLVDQLDNISCVLFLGCNLKFSTSNHRKPSFPASIFQFFNDCGFKYRPSSSITSAVMSFIMRAEMRNAHTVIYGGPNVVSRSAGMNIQSTVTVRTVRLVSCWVLIGYIEKPLVLKSKSKFK